MTQPTRVHIFTRDAQGVEETLSFYVTPGDFGAAVTLPTKAHIETAIGTIFATPALGTPSTSVVTGYSVEVLNLFDFGATLGGDGTVGTPIAAKMRSGVGETGRVGLLGPEGDEFKIPGMNKDALSFLSNNRSVINVVGAPWIAIRNALVALGYQDASGFVFSTTDALEAGVTFNGKRAPIRQK